MRFTEFHGIVGVAFEYKLLSVVKVNHGKYLVCYPKGKGGLVKGEVF